MDRHDGEGKAAGRWEEIVDKEVGETGEVEVLKGWRERLKNAAGKSGLSAGNSRAR